jgi:hypothetical protein
MAVQKGHTNNPGGRRADPKGFKAMRDYLGLYSEEFAIELIDRALGRMGLDGTRDKTTADLKALELAMAYLYGKPPAVIAGEGGNGPAKLEIVRRIIDTANAVDV